MRHLRRLYFDNHPPGDRGDLFVAFLDQGKVGGAHRYIHFVGALSSASDIISAMTYLVASPCYFKLPVGATAVVDIYVPFNDSAERKIFDYQVFKAKLPSPMTQAGIQALNEYRTRLGKIPSEILSFGVLNSTGSQAKGVQPNPNGDPDPETHCIEGLPCCTTSEPCNGQTDRVCDDPIGTIANCRDGNLECDPYNPVVAPGDQSSR